MNRTSSRTAALALAAAVPLTLSSLALFSTPAAAAPTHDLRAGAVFSQSNDPAGNAIVAFARNADGGLDRVGAFATGGTGSGGFEDSANSVVLGTSNGEVSPNNNLGNGDLLYVTNAGSDTVSVFKVERDGLRLVEVQPSGENKPVSITVNRGIAYVLNSNEVQDGLVVPNCAAPNQSKLPSITGFTVSADGQLTPIPGSTRELSTASGCAQVSFNPTGTAVVVTERTARTADQAADDEGVINTFPVNADGTLGERRVYDATGSGPFGFTFSKQGDLLTSEQEDGPAGPGRGGAAGYRLDRDGTLTASGPSATNGGTDSCWFVVTDNGRYGYVSSFFGDGQISRYLVGQDGALTLDDAQADRGSADPGASDLAVSRNSQHLYSLNSFQGTVDTYRIGAQGQLELVDSDQAHPASASAAPLGLAAS
jgi:6-phosphogluconolactonase